MIDSLYIAATGMHAQQTNVETISNNLANLNTTAFKRGRISFEDLMYREVARARGVLGTMPTCCATARACHWREAARASSRAISKRPISPTMWRFAAADCSSC